MDPYRGTTRRRGRGFASAVGMLVVVAVAAAALASCSGRDIDTGGGQEVTTAVPQRGGRLVYALEADPNGLDPTRNAWDNTGLQVANALYDPLAAFDEEGQARPYLAESFSANADHTVWTVTLRQGVTFSNGRPFDAEALVHFLQKLRESAITGPPARYFADVRAVDPRTVEVTMSHPWASLPALMAGQGGYVIAPEQLEDGEGHSKPIGTGPFVLRSWNINDRLVLDRNPNYWRPGLPYLDSVEFVVVPEGGTRIERVARGEVDATAVTGPWDLRVLDQTVARQGSATTFSVEKDRGDAEKANVLFNTRRPPLDDRRVRRAIAHATDVPAIASRNGWPLDRIAQGPISPESPYFSPAPFPTYNPDRARELLREYLEDPNVPNRPPEISFTLMAAASGAEFVAQLAEQWAAVGITARIEHVDVKQAVRYAVVGTYDALVFRYFAAPDPDILWHFFVNDTLAEEGISLNFARLRSDVITAGMNEGRASTDVGVRRSAYAKVQQALAEEMPYLWLQREEWRVASANRVRDARNVTLPDGSPAMPFLAGTHRLAETWLQR